MANKQPLSEIETHLLRDLIASGADLERMAEALPNRTRDAVRVKSQAVRRTVKPTGSLPGPLPNGAEQLIRDFKGDNQTITARTERNIQSLADLVEFCSIDLSEWSIFSWSCKAWSGYAKDAVGNIQTRQLYAVSARLCRRSADIEARDMVADAIAALRANAPKIKHSAPSVKSGGLMLEISIPDTHFGKLAWWKECGESYDVSIARSLFIAAVDELLDKAQGYKFAKIVLVVGNDLLNADNFENMTTKGTPQSTDGRQQKTFKIVADVIRTVVETKLMPLSESVDVVMVPGNHDRQTNWFLGEILSAYFDKVPGVCVENSPTLRKYVEFGKVALMFTHGNEERHSSLPLLMATERPDLWGRTRFREIHLGHLHQRRSTQFLGTQEHNGVMVRILPSLCAPEDWHVSRGYVGNIRSAEAYIWDSENGLVGTVIFNAPERPDLMQVAA